MPYTLKPVRPPEIDAPRPESPVTDFSERRDSLTAGMSFTVVGLDNAGPGSASKHANLIIRQHNESHPDDILPPLHITPIDDRKPLNYVMISLPTEVSPEPRPDILTDVMRIFKQHNNLSVSWTLGLGLDKSRRIYYQASSRYHLPELLKFITNTLKSKSIPTNGVFANDSYNRAYFNIARFQDIDWLVQHPIIFNHDTFTAQQPCFIHPLYGGECVVFGFQSFQGVLPTINHYLRQCYGLDCIAYSRMQLNGDAYCVVFNKWRIASWFFKKPFLAFADDPIVGETGSISKPVLLFTYNTCGCPTNPAHLASANSTAAPSSPQMKQIATKLDNTQRQGRKLMESFQSTLNSHSNAIQDIQVQNQETVTSISIMNSSMLAQSLLSDERNNLCNLITQKSSLRLMHSIAKKDTQPKISSKIDEVERQIQQQQASVATAEQQAKATQRLLLPAPPPLPPPAPPAPPPAPPPTSPLLCERSTDTLQDEREPQIDLGSTSLPMSTNLCFHLIITLTTFRSQICWITHRTELA